MVDAVTMDVYDIYIGGDIFAMLHWKPAMEELLDGLGMYDIFNDGIYNVSLNLQDYKVFVRLSSDIMLIRRRAMAAATDSIP